MAFNIYIRAVYVTVHKELNRICDTNTPSCMPQYVTL